jgi:hypothetical protein
MIAPQHLEQYVSAQIVEDGLVPSIYILVDHGGRAAAIITTLEEITKCLFTLELPRGGTLS